MDILGGKFTQKQSRMSNLEKILPLVSKQILTNDLVHVQHLL